MAIARYNANGTLDGTFGDADPNSGRRTGRRTLNLGSGGNGATGIAIQRVSVDNQIMDKIVIVGHALNASSGNDAFAVARLNPDGTLDANFGTGGIVTSDGFGGDSGNDRAKAVAIQDDGTIVVAGTLSESTVIGCGGTCFAVERFSPDGVEIGPVFQLASFGADTTAEAVAMTLQTDGKVVVVGTLGAGGGGPVVGREPLLHGPRTLHGRRPTGYDLWL